jgi:succinate dehydrogenase/fumarate reductase cytochrome b subunit
MKNFASVNFVRIFHRWSGILLIVFVGLKIVSGYSVAGDIDVLGHETAERIHFASWVDIPLLFLFVFHSCYGLLKILRQYFSGKQNLLFYIMTSLAIVLFVLAVIFIYII